MLFSTFLFYLFSTILLASALIVVSARNTVHSVMFLILSFLNASALFVLLGAEFLAMLLIIVYVGAIAVLFLFVVMMLDIDHTKIRKNAGKYFPLALIIGIILLVEIILIIKIATTNLTIKLFVTPENISNTKALGNIIYTDFILPFQLAGAVLFVAMIGAIVLTIKDETRFIRKQKISHQVFREKADAIEIVKVKVGEGLDI